MIGRFFFFNASKILSIYRISNITHDSNNTGRNFVIMIRKQTVIINSTYSPSLTTNHNILIAVISEVPINATSNSRLLLKIMENSNSLAREFAKIVNLYCKTNLKTIRFGSFAGMNKIKIRNTSIINSSNISILHTIKIRSGSKTLGISKRTLRT